MKIVICIDDEVYSHVKDYENRVLTPNEENILRDCIANGTPLPNRHGRLIDADAIQTYQIDTYGQGLSIIDNAPTIIEADKE